MYNRGRGTESHPARHNVQMMVAGGAAGGSFFPAERDDAGAAGLLMPPALAPHPSVAKTSNMLLMEAGPPVPDHASAGRAPTPPPSSSRAEPLPLQAGGLTRPASAAPALTPSASGELVHVSLQ